MARGYLIPSLNRSNVSIGMFSQAISHPLYARVILPRLPIFQGMVKDEAAKTERYVACRATSLFFERRQSRRCRVPSCCFEKPANGECHLDFCDRDSPLDALGRLRVVLINLKSCSFSYRGFSVVQTGKRLDDRGRGQFQGLALSLSGQSRRNLVRGFE